MRPKRPLASRFIFRNPFDLDIGSTFRLFAEVRMKNWLSIGQFAKRAELTSRTLRVYEKEGLILSHTRGENGYRYYQEQQLELISRIKNFKLLGFSLREIKTLLQVDELKETDNLKEFLKKRLQVILEKTQDLANQKKQVESILSSLKQIDQGLGPIERRYIMSHFEKISIVITGLKDLETTAQHIQQYLLTAGQKVEVLLWTKKVEVPKFKPHILVIPESLLRQDEVRRLKPDVVVIKNLSHFNPNIEKAYLNLYGEAGPHMTTIFNADDRISVELAANHEIRKGRTYYFSKNSGLRDQIEEIGGVVSNGDEVNIYGGKMLARVPMSLKLNRILGFDEEVALISSLAAVMDIGLEPSTFFKSPV